MCIPQPVVIKRCSLRYTIAFHVNLRIIKRAVNETWTGLAERFKEEGALHGGSLPQTGKV